MKQEAKLKQHPRRASQNLKILFLASQLPNLGCYCYWKSLECMKQLRNI